MLLVIKARGLQVYSRRSVAYSVTRRAGRCSWKRVHNESMLISPCGMTEFRAGNCSSLQKSEGGSAHTRRSASNTICARGKWRSEQFLTPARYVLCAREDGGASVLGHSSVADHACSFMTVMWCVGRSPTRIDYGI